MSLTPGARVTLCGSLEVEVNGCRLAAQLPARQGRLLFAYLVLHRERRASRDELVEALWGDHPPASPGRALSPVLSRLRRVLEPMVEVDAGGAVGLALPPASWVDVDAACAAADASTSAASAGDWDVALEQGSHAASVLERPLLPGLEARWIDETRRRLDRARAVALESAATAGIALGGADLAVGERAARELIARAPLHESGYRLLMEAHTARGHVAEALRVYDLLRCLLREELGAAPTGEVRTLHGHLLRRIEDDRPPVDPPRFRRAERLAPALLELEAEPFAGRQPELARLGELWRDADADRGRLVVLAGHEGIGKTRLAARFAAQIHASAGKVLHGRCYDDTFPYLPFASALGREASIASLSADPDDRDTRDGAAAAIVRFFRETQRPLLLVLDDLQWADRASLAVLKHLLISPGPGPLLVVATCRLADLSGAHPLAEALSYLRGDRRVAEITLEQLDMAASRELVEAHAGYAPDAETIADLYRRTAGSPLLLRELAVALAEEGVGVPAPLIEALERRVELLGRDTVRMLRGASALGDPFDVTAAQVVAGLPTEAALDGLERALAVGLLVEGRPGRYRFACEVVREAIRDAMVAPRRTSLEERASTVVQMRPSV